MKYRVISELPINTRPRSLWKIYQRMSDDVWRWQKIVSHACIAPYVDEVVFNPITFMLAYCIEKAYGPMEWGNWLRIPFTYFADNRFGLGPDEVLLLGLVPTIYGGWPAEEFSTTEPLLISQKEV